MYILRRFSEFIHNNLLLLLLCAYGIAAFAPALGNVIRHCEFGKISFAAREVKISLPVIMLAFLLFNSGLAVKLANLVDVIKVTTPFFLALFSNIIIPLVFIFLFSLFGKYFWSEPEEIQNIMVGLTVIAAMPVAGSSAVWAQHARGNPALILTLIVTSTLLSPFIAPLVFYVGSLMANGEHARDLAELAEHGVNFFLVIVVVIPALCGLLFRAFLKEQSWLKIAPTLKTLNLVNLLVLSYSNASGAFPRALEHWKLDFLIMIVVAVVLLYCSNFISGWIISFYYKLHYAEKVSLFYGLIMRNNGIGLVLVLSVLSNHPLIVLPLIFYNLWQQFVAGVVDAKFLNKKLSTEETAVSGQ